MVSAKRRAGHGPHVCTQQTSEIRSSQVSHDCGLIKDVYDTNPSRLSPGTQPVGLKATLTRGSLEQNAPFATSTRGDLAARSSPLRRSRV